MQEWLADVEEGVVVTHCTAQDTPYDIAGTPAGGQLSVGNSKRYRPNVVGNNPHGHITLSFSCITGRVLLAGYLFDETNEGRKYIGIIGSCLPLQHHAKALEAHTCVYMAGRQRFQLTIGLAVELDKYVVPDLNHTRVIGID